MTSARGYREKLIDEVKKYPVLYDTRHENHRDVDVRDRCWREISDRLGANSEVLKREWKILRDSYRQALKKSKKGTLTKAGVPCKKWRFQSRMNFILPYMTNRRLRQIKMDDRDMKADDMRVDDTDFQSDHELDTDVWDPGQTSASSDGDALDLFFASVCQSTKRLPTKLQNLVKRQVLDVLLRIEEDYENEQAEVKPFDQA